MKTDQPSFRLDAMLIQIFLTGDQITTFRSINMPVFFASVIAFPFGSIYGTYLLIGSSQATIVLFNSSIIFRVLTLLLALVLPIFAIWVFILLAKARLAKVTSAEEMARFLANRRGNVTLGWDKVETATLEGNKVVFHLKKGGFRAGRLKQVYYNEGETLNSVSTFAQLGLLREFLSQELGDAFEING